MNVVSVILMQKSKFIDKEFDYFAKEEVEEGDRVSVPFGKSNKILLGIVTKIKKIDNTENIEKNFKNILEVLDKHYISKNNIQLAYWIKETYLCSLFEAISLFSMPINIKSNSYEIFLEPMLSKEDIDELISKERSNATLKKYILNLLKNGSINITNLQKETGKSFYSLTKKLENLGIAKIKKISNINLPKNNYSLEYKDIIFTDEQYNAIKKINLNILNKKNTLLFGETGSGKTEIYIELTKNCINRNKQAIILVPEISLAPQTIARFKNVFGDRIGIFHSKISKKEKEDQIKLIKEHKIDIIIGARSALFVPFDDLGLVIIDEAHDDSYKSDQNPRYDSIEVAEKICKLRDASLIIGSATPTITQYYDALNGRFSLEKLTKKSNGKDTQIEIIDTLEHSIVKNNKIFTDEVLSKIKIEVEKNNQIIIFLNKRGFANSLTCNYCNYTKMCNNCDITLTYHKQGNKLLCHYCGYEENFDSKCYNCNMEYDFIGYGTQAVEKEILENVENIKISRLDKDTTKNKNSYEKILSDFKDKKTNILIGTQMISKGLDFQDVSLVVILNAEQGLKFPDYRSYEKTFNMLLQVSGRTGRSDKESMVLIQTNDSKNFIFELLKNKNYEEFYNNEIKERKVFLYPPFSFLLKIKCSSSDLEKAAETTKKIKDAIEFYSRYKNVKFDALGPVQNYIKRIDNKFSWQIFYKIQDENNFLLIKKILNFILSKKRSIIVDKDVIVSVEVNPKSLI